MKPQGTLRQCGIKEQSQERLFPLIDLSFIPPLPSRTECMPSESDHVASRSFRYEDSRVGVRGRSSC